MTNKELLYPRMEVIEGYPDSPFKIGEILVFDFKSVPFILSYAPTSPVEEEWHTAYALDGGTAFYSIKKFEEFPILFKFLKWYEKRKLEDLPEYIKLLFNNKIHYVRKVERRTGENSASHPLFEYYNNAGCLSTGCVAGLDPATEEEYIDFQNLKKC